MDGAAPAKPAQQLLDLLRPRDLWSGGVAGVPVGSDVDVVRPSSKSHMGKGWRCHMRCNSPYTPWDCHRTADQARGGARGVN